MTLAISTRSVHALRAMLAVDGMAYEPPCLYLQRQKDDVIDLYATDGYGAVAIEAPTVVTDLEFQTLKITTEGLKIPAKAASVDLLFEGIPGDGFARTDSGAKIGFLHVTSTSSAPVFRGAVPRSPRRLPAGNPAAFDPLRAAKVLAAAKERDSLNSRIVHLSGTTIAYEWEFSTGGKYTLVGLRDGDDGIARTYWDLIKHWEANS
jgi:hypothetical protein